VIRSVQKSQRALRKGDDEKVSEDYRSHHSRIPRLCHSLYDKNPLRAVQDSIKNRHYHKGFMAEYKRAYALVKRAIETGEEPLLGSWF